MGGAKKKGKKDKAGWFPPTFRDLLNMNTFERGELPLIDTSNI